jgi:signal transduction histidine kinase
MEGSAEYRSPRVTDVLLATLRHLPSETRRAIRYVLVAYAGVLLLQVWDSRNSTGASGVAEFASVILGTAGFLLLGLVHVLRRAGEPAARPVAPEGQHPRLPVEADPPAVRQKLMALPLVGTSASILLSAAVAFLMARVWLGSSTIVLVIAAVYVIALAAAVNVVRDATSRLYTHAQEQAIRAARMQAQLTGARLAALQAQMNPHFLFNALNTVASLARSNPAAAEQTVENLSEVLRTTLDRSQQLRGTLESEIAFVRAYLEVERERFGSRLHVVYDIAPGLNDASVPSFSLQPLVENALKHGLGPRREGGAIRIAAEREGDRLMLAVEDNGEGFDARYIEGTGLGNLRARLEAMYGATASLNVMGVATGSRVTIALPWDVKESHDARAGR